MSQDSPDDPERTGSTEADGPTERWSLDDLMLPAPPAWPDPAYPEPGARQAHRPVYYVSLTAAVLLVLGMVATLVVLSLNRPVTRTAGEATGLAIPALPSPTRSTPPSTGLTQSDPLAALADHPLSTSTATMARLTCALPTFDPADATQERFYRAAKACADGAFGGLLPAAGLPAPGIAVVTVQGGPMDTPCGVVAPTDPATQCQGTVYMTPARLRDVEGLDRYPGKYFGVFLREYASAVQAATGLTELYEQANASPDAPAGLDVRLAQQAICLAGIASGAMAGLGAVDDNITNEIRARLTSTDAPPDADAWLTKGFQSRQLASCDAWLG